MSPSQDGALGIPIPLWRAAEQAAAENMRLLGFVDAAVTPPGTDAGVDVRSADAVAQVKARKSPAGRPEVQKLHGAAHAEQKLGLYYSTGGYTQTAVEWADEVGVALFVLDPSGRSRPVNEAAAELFPPTPLDRQHAATEDRPRTVGDLLEDANGESLFVQLPEGRAATGRAFAQLVATRLDKPLRTIDAELINHGNTIPSSLCRGLVYNQVVYLDRIEEFRGAALTILLGLFGGAVGLHSTVDYSPTANERDGLVDEVLRSVPDPREGARDPVLIVKPPGDRLTGFSAALAAKLSCPVVGIDPVSSPMPGHLAAALTYLTEPAVVVIDDVTAYPSGSQYQEVVATAAKGVLLVMLGQGAGARRVTLTVPTCSFLLTTSEPDLLVPRLRDACSTTLSTGGTRHMVETAIRSVWKAGGVTAPDECVGVVADRAQSSRRKGALLARRILQHLAQGAPSLDFERASSLAGELDIDVSGFAELDWLLFEWALGAAGLRNGEGVRLPPVTVIASTSIRGDRAQDLRSSLGAFADMFSYRVVLPRTKSQNMRMLAFELGGVPLLGA